MFIIHKQKNVLFFFGIIVDDRIAQDIVDVSFMH